MQESKFYQLQRERFFRENTIDNTLALLQDRFHPEAVSAVKPLLHSIEDVPRLKQLLLAASKVPNIETFSQLLCE